jgi:hypothetical protein
MIPRYAVDAKENFLSAIARLTASRTAQVHAVLVVAVPAIDAVVTTAVVITVVVITVVVVVTIATIVVAVAIVAIIAAGIMDATRTAGTTDAIISPHLPATNRRT